MAMRFVIALASLLTALAATGCTDACRSYCDKSNACTSGFPDSCDGLCVQEEDDASHTGCQSQYSGYASCRNNAPDVCTDHPQTRCSVEVTALEQCVNAYCAAHPSETALCSRPLP